METIGWGLKPEKHQALLFPVMVIPIQEAVLCPQHLLRIKNLKLLRSLFLDPKKFVLRLGQLSDSRLPQILMY